MLIRSFGKAQETPEGEKAKGAGETISGPDGVRIHAAWHIVIVIETFFFIKQRS